MTELEKEIRGFESCVGYDHLMLCSTCPYHADASKCVTTLMRDALALLKAQIPRVMTLDEVREDHDRVVWIECDASKTMNIGQYRGQIWWHEKCATKWERFVTMSFANDYLHRRADKYGKEWRCWTSRPSPEQMRDTPWEGNAE